MVGKNEILGSLYESVDNGETLLVFGAGSGLSARAANMAGVHLISVYSTAILRMKGLNSLLSALPVSNSNELLLQEGAVIVQAAGNTPCIAGICAQDPFHSLDEMFDAAKKMGFIGVSNEPFAGMYGDWFSLLLEEYGMGFSAELEMLKQANEKGFLTLGWAFNEEQAVRLTEENVDIIGVMVMDGPVSETKKETPKEHLEKAVNTVRRICHAVLEVNPQALMITHGDPFYDVQTATASLVGTGAVGYASGSSGERIPAIEGIAAAGRAFLEMG